MPIWLVRCRVVGIDQGRRESGDSSLSTAEYLRSVRESAGLSIAEVAGRAGVDEHWLEQVEAGAVAEGPNYDLLLKLVAATQPPLPDWWDNGHEHDLHLPRTAVHDKDNKHLEYWRRIEQVRESNRRGPGS
jgi:transcriptional regulator with XRE-family HTH domain